MSEEQVEPRLAWGLDLSKPDVTTQAEIDEFRRISSESLGAQQQGLEFWLNEDPEVLKRYRSWASLLNVDRDGPDPTCTGNVAAILVRYAEFGFLDGLKYTLLGTNIILTKAEMLEVFSLAFRYLGPAGMANVAQAAEGFPWAEPTQPAVWPQGWAPDPQAFRSGVDFSTPTLSKDELALIEAWYERYLGEVPGHVSFLGRNRPEVLKAYRSRFENTLRLLPKQVEPAVQIQISVERAFPQGIREGVLLARGFGMAKIDVLEAITWGTFYGTTPVLDVVQDSVADLLDTWKDPS